MKKKLGITFYLVLVATVFILAGGIYLSVQISSLADTLDRRNESMAEGLTETGDELERLKGMFLELAADTNEVRATLMLPERNYLFDSSEPQKEDQTNLEFFRGLDTILEKHTRDTASKNLGEFLGSTGFTQKLKDLSLSSHEENSLTADLLRNGRLFFTIKASDPEEISLRSLSGAEITVTEYSQELSDFMESESALLEAHYLNHKVLTEGVEALLRGSRLSKILEDNNLSWKFPENGDGLTAGTVHTKDGRRIFGFGVTAAENGLQVAQTPVKDLESFEEMFIRVIEASDLRSSEEIMIERSAERILSLTEDAGFRKYLESKSMTLAEKPREDSDYFYFDLLNPDGRRMGSFAVQKMLGEIYLMDEDDVPISSLKTGTLSISDEKKN